MPKLAVASTLAVTDTPVAARKFSIPRSPHFPAAKTPSKTAIALKAEGVCGQDLPVEPVTGDSSTT